MSSDYSPPVFVTKDTNGNYVVTLASGLSFTVKDHSGTAIFTATDGGPDVVSIDAAFTNTIPSGQTSSFKDHSGNVVLLVDDTQERIQIGAASYWHTSGAMETASHFVTYNNIPTAGLGVPAIYQVGHGVGATTAQTVTYTPPATAGCYIVTVAIQVTTAGTSTIPTLSYHDASGNTVTSQAMSMKQVTSTSAPVTSITATGYWAYDYPVSVDNSGSPITVVITPTGSTFNYEVFIRQVR